MNYVQIWTKEENARSYRTTYHDNTLFYGRQMLILTRESQSYTRSLNQIKQPL